MTHQDRGPIQTCDVLKDAARVLPPYLHCYSESQPFEGEAAVMTVLGGTKELDQVLAKECEGRVVIIDAYCQTHTAFVSTAQIRAAIDGKVKAIIVFGAICDFTKLKRAPFPLIAMGITPSSASPNVGQLIRHRIQTDVGVIRDDGIPGKSGDYVIGSENGIVIVRTSLFQKAFP